MNFPFQDGRLPRWARSSEPNQLKMSPVRWATSFPKQLVLTMQASAILLFAVCLQASATGLGQTVSFTGKDVPLKTVFISIKKQTGYGIFYQNGEAATLEGTSTVTLDLKNVALDFFLQVALRNQPLEYSVEGTTIFVKKKEARPSLTVEVGPGTPIAEIHGHVTNDKGEPLVNANITVKRTGHGTITDANGNFTLHNVNSDDIVTVSFIGYTSQSIPVRDRANLTVFMNSTTNDLDKVVVQAYGTTSQRLATGNIGTVTAEDIAKQPVMNPMEALQGQVPGVVLTQMNGYASSPIKVEIRGRNSIGTFPSDPLYIIDGVPLTILDLNNTDSYDQGSQGVIQSGIASPASGQSPFFSINPADIENIEVLKDADATAIYGSRGANGVILITTKKGKAGKTRLNVEAYQGLSKVMRHFPFLSTKQYVAMRDEAFQNDGLSPDIYSAPDLIAWDTTRYFDWQKYLFGGTGKETDVQSNLTGGDMKTTFRINADYHRQTSILTLNGAEQRGALSLNVNHKSLDQKLSMSISAIYSLTSSNMIYIPGAPNFSPNTPPLFNKNGNLNYLGWQPLDGSYPAGSLLQPYSSKSNFLNSSLEISYEISKGLILKTNLGYGNIQTTQSYVVPIASQDPIYNPTGSSFVGYSFIHNYVLEPQMQYDRYVGKGKLSILGGTSYQGSYTTGASLQGRQYTTDALIQSVGFAPNQTASNNSGAVKYTAVFGRINYNWENKYIINLNGRRDGSSKFGPGRQYGNFGSVGVAWIFSEENWFKRHLPFISFGKLRSSYGLTGSDPIGPFQYYTQWTFGIGLYNANVPIYPLGHTDSLLHWQVNKKAEIALNLGFLQDRITLQAVYYRNRSNDQIVLFPTPAFTGFPNVRTNSPAEVQNAGYEFEMNTKIVDTKKIKWSVKGNIGFNRNKLLSYPNLSQSPYRDLYVIGQPLNITKVLHWTGVDPQTGLHTFQDVNKDGQITMDFSGKTSDDRHPLNIHPKFSGGLSTSFVYGEIELSMFFYFVNQIGRNAYSALNTPGMMSNEPVEVLKRWQKPGDITNIAKFTTNPTDISYTNYQYYSDAIFTNASYIRLQNLSITYSPTKKLLNGHKLLDWKLYARGQNLFVITKYKGVDPEIQNFYALPLPKIVTIGISLNL